MKGAQGGRATNSIMMLVKFLTSANQKHRIWSCDESGLCNPRPRLLGGEVVVGPSLMFRKMDPWNVIRNVLQDKTNMLLVKFLTSANQKHRIWSCDESGLCNPRPRLLGGEVVVGPSLMFRKMDPWNVIRNVLQDKTNKNQLQRELVFCW